MKIAIKADSDRREEIISLLESFGGTKSNLKGDGQLHTYYIDKNYIIRYDYPPIDYKIYTLEQFKKEFPFRVGDKVLHWEFNEPFTIDSFYPNSVYPYTISGVCTFSTKASALTKYIKQDMKTTEKPVMITFEKAKEWYNKGGELKEIALQAFTEEELTKKELPKTWKEFCREYPVQKGECWLEGGDGIEQTLFFQDRICKNWIPSKESAKAHLAMIQLEQLRDCWRQGWKPNWSDCTSNKYIIEKVSEKYTASRHTATSKFLSFQSQEIAEEFLKCFRYLIELAGDLI